MYCVVVHTYNHQAAIKVASAVPPMAPQNFQSNLLLLLLLPLELEALVEEEEGPPGWFDDRVDNVVPTGWSLSDVTAPDDVVVNAILLLLLCLSFLIYCSKLLVVVGVVGLMGVAPTSVVPINHHTPPITVI
jgi:hypothetical protein